MFLTWYTVDWRIAGTGHSESVNGWDATNVARAGVRVRADRAAARLAIELFSRDSELPVPASIVSGVCGILAVLFIVYRIASAPDAKVSGLLGFTALQNFISRDGEHVVGHLGQPGGGRRDGGRGGAGAAQLPDVTAARPG